MYLVIVITPQIYNISHNSASFLPQITAVSKILYKFASQKANDCHPHVAGKETIMQSDSGK